ncbi:DGQHR domain-containing protein [Sphaerospermopsis torques-reginae]|uniref:DGQHR domain-containing protein n=1 Tax=Sphaerospermopsis torques-reginae ITEP-024 TaxID=984208 RepID=A0ABX8WZT7_9CYAN|nr:DGQHR domain-containing protein [Sphaerospermopsis torques-reginae]QYX31958.1 DGQHR domain-containing protein [Sphaerospermopsis torques-reginae ITEP-024]
MTIEIPAFKILQNEIPMLVFIANAKMIYERFDVSRRIDDKKLGYQRSFSKTRIKEIKNYINGKGIIPNSILVNIDEGKFDYHENNNLLVLEDTDSLGLIIDGQHRVNGCYDANPDFPLMVIATLGLSVKDQARLFVTINKTQKGVPTSLYLDLMDLLEGEIEDFDGEGVTAERRAREIAIRLNETDESPLYELIRTTGEAGFGISLNEFVTQIRDYVEPKTGKLANLGFEQQYKVFEIYFRSVKAVFLEQWNDPKSYILKTVGFGGLMAAFYEVFNLVMQKYQMFNTENTIKLLRSIQDFKFDKDNLPGGAGFKAQEKVGDMIVSKLKNAVREDFAVMIGD